SSPRRGRCIADHQPYLHGRVARSAAASVDGGAGAGGVDLSTALYEPIALASAIGMEPGQGGPGHADAGVLDDRGSTEHEAVYLFSVLRDDGVLSTRYRVRVVNERGDAI